MKNPLISTIKNGGEESVVVIVNPGHLLDPMIGLQGETAEEIKNFVVAGISHLQRVIDGWETQKKGATIEYQNFIDGLIDSNKKIINYLSWTLNDTLMAEVEATPLHLPQQSPSPAPPLDTSQI